MRVARWRAALVAGFLTVSVGLFVGRGEFLLLAVVPLAYVAYGYTSAPADPDLRIRRELSEDEPVPGDVVTVRLDVENAGERTLGDVRLVDGVPEDVAVVEGDPALASTLRPGEEHTVEYEVRPSRGDHEFDPPEVRVRNLAGTSVDTRAVAADGDAALTCETLLDEFPTRQETIQYVGGVPTGVTGSGVEFHSTREYRRGDPLSRIDWKRLARTGELTTVEFRTERSVVVVFVVDDRDVARFPVAGGGPDAVDLATHAASQGLVALVEEGHRVGVARLSAVERGLGPGEWVEPGADRTTRTAAAEEFDRIRGPDSGAASGVVRERAGGPRAPRSVASGERDRRRRPRSPGEPEPRRGTDDGGRTPAEPPPGGGRSPGEPGHPGGSAGESGDQGRTPGEPADPGESASDHTGNGGSAGEPTGSDGPSGRPAGPQGSGGSAGDPGGSNVPTGESAGPEREGAGREHRPVDGHRAVGGGAGPSAGSAAARGERLALALSERLPSRAQVVVCSPLVDDVVPAMVSRLEAGGHGASVLSPDVFGPGEGRTRTVTRLERRNRVYALQSRGVPTTDWDVDTPLPIALGEAFARWRGETG